MTCFCCVIRVQCVQGYKSVCVAVTIFTTLVDIEPDRQTDRQADTHTQTRTLSSSMGYYLRVRRAKERENQ